MENEENENWQVLLIDDDEDDYVLTRSMLIHSQGRQIQLDWASTYEQGKQLLQSNCYDAVLVDYDLGPRTGIELIRETSACGYSAPLILYTGRGSYQVDVEAMEAGATLYITKSEANPLLLERAIRYAIENKQMKSELERRLQERAEILESISDAFYSLDQEERFTYVNQKAVSSLGKQPAELIGKKIWEVFPSGVETESYSKIKHALDIRQPVHYESYSKYIDQWVDIHLYPTEQGISVFFQDITERKQAEEKLRESERKFSLIFTKATYAAALSKLPEGALVDVNEAWEALLGYTREEAIGKTTLELNINPDAEARSRILTQLREKGFAREQEVALYTKSGEQRIFSLNVDLLDIDGEKYILNTAIDITERKNAQKRLEEANRTLQEQAQELEVQTVELRQQTEELFDVNEKLRLQTRLIQLSYEPIFIWDLDSGIQSWNEGCERLYGYSQAEVLGKNTHELLKTQHPVSRDKFMAQLLKEGRWMGELRHRTKDGRQVIVESRHELLVVDGRRLVLETNRDITGHKKENI